MTVSLVAARALNHVIGNGPNIPWRVKGEQKLFREITLGGILIMGRKTFESIGKPLPGRSTIIVSRDITYQAQGCQSASSLDAALQLTEADPRPVFIVGGGEIYRQALAQHLVDTVHLTTIQTEVDGDVIFPTFPTPEFTLVRETLVESNINYIYQYFEKASQRNTAIPS
jgi:dihydrofolate reductase (trimethoprim resistance protein)